jgi:hypothetical protein
LAAFVVVFLAALVLLAAGFFEPKMLSQLSVYCWLGPERTIGPDMLRVSPESHHEEPRQMTNVEFYIGSPVAQDATHDSPRQMICSQSASGQPS